MWTLGIGATIVVGLLIDQLLQPYGQYLVNSAVFVVFGFLIFQSTKSERKKWWVCLALATLGEIILCELYGLYEYRDGSIPFFVPPGHVLLYAAGLWTSQYVNRLIPWITLAIGFVYSSYCLIKAVDQISLVFFSLWILMFFKVELRPLITTMLIMALGMELLGTGLGNWVWAENVPVFQFSLTQSNPPFAVGVLYCGLDFLVGLFTKPKLIQA